MAARRPARAADRFGDVRVIDCQDASRSVGEGSGGRASPSCLELRQCMEWLRRWRMPRSDVRGHEMVCGTIGMGKSYWVLHEILESFARGCPLTYIDPKGTCTAPC
jgi:hypothetical protein